MGLITVNTVQLKECIIRDLRAGLTPMVTSSPGIGKSDVMRDVAAEFNLKGIDIRVSQCEPVDMQGYPAVVDGRMTFHVPEYFPIVGDKLPLLPPKEDGTYACDEKGKPLTYAGWIIFLDEFNSGNKQTEAAGYKLILDKEVYIHKLHPNCVIAAAGNLTTDRAIVNTQSTATTSRLTHYKLVVDVDVWIDWAFRNKIDHRVIAFIKYKPSVLHKFDPATSEMTFPCPRTWAFASKIVTGQSSIDPINKIRLAGTVGEGAAHEFAVYTEIYDRLPTIEEILKDPAKGWTVPTEASEKFAVSAMLTQAIKEDNAQKIVTAIDRLPMEFRVITFKNICKRSPELGEHELIEGWITKNASKMYG